MPGKFALIAMCLGLRASLPALAQTAQMQAFTEYSEPIPSMLPALLGNDPALRVKR